MTSRMAVARMVGPRNAMPTAFGASYARLERGCGATWGLPTRRHALP